MKTLKTAGLRHLALTVKNLEECVAFYTDIIGMTIEWQPDDDNVYLTSGNDNLALHRAPADFMPGKHQRLDHLGFIIETPEAVDEWHAYFVENHINIKMKPKTHRDGARSFYAADPDGNPVQMIFHPPLC
jgi:catechol 2,3-dioxygenase-like lactoylglutathione lyase family enzyme